MSTKTVDFDIVDLVDNGDGSMTLRVDMNMETLKIFAGIGLIKAMKDEAERAIKDGYFDTEGTGDTEAGTPSGGPVSRELP